MNKTLTRAALTTAIVLSGFGIAAPAQAYTVPGSTGTTTHAGVTTTNTKPSMTPMRPKGRHYKCFRANVRSNCTHTR